MPLPATGRLVVIGPQGAAVRSPLEGLKLELISVEQEGQLGTGHLVAIYRFNPDGLIAPFSPLGARPSQDQGQGHAGLPGRAGDPPGGS